MNNPRRLVAIGVQGEIASAVEDHLRDGEGEFVGLDRGDDITRPVEEASVVVVLDAARPQASVSDYEIALRAVAEGLRRSAAEHVVSVVLYPPEEDARRAFRERAANVEAEVRRTGARLTAIRCGLVIGTPELQGPIDDVLVSSWPVLLVPGDGTQRVKPIRLDDLARLVAEVAKRPGCPEVAAEGPDELSLDELFRVLNGQSARLAHYSPRLFDLVALMLPFVPAQTRVHLPSRDFHMPGADPGRALGISTVGLAEAWTPGTRQARLESRARRRSPSLYAATRSSTSIACFLVALGVAGAVTGFHDALVAVDHRPRLTGLGLGLASLFIALTGASLFKRTRAARYALAFLGAVGASVLIAVILLAGLLYGDAPTVLWLAGAYLLPSALGSCVALWRRGGLVGARFARGKGLKSLAALAAGGTTLAVAQFLYSSLYEPATATPTVTASASLTTTGPVARWHAVLGTVRLRNTSKHSVNILASTYEVRVRDVPSTGDLDARALVDEPTRRVWRHDLELEERLRRYPVARASQPVETGGIVPSATFLEPGEEIEKRFVALAPPEADLSSLAVDLIFARRRFDRQADSSLGIKPLAGQEVAYADAEIEDPSWVHRLTRSSRFIHTIRGLDGKPPSGCARLPVVAYVDNQRETDLADGACSRPAKRMELHYGITNTGTSAEVSLGQEQETDG